MDIKKIFASYEKVFEPLDDSPPCGIDLRDDIDSLYFKVRNARVNARDEERKAVSDGSEDAYTTSKLWPSILKDSTEILCKHSKDLEVLVWFWEALERVYGWQGLAVGAELCHKFLDLYWDQYFPDPDDDLEDRILPVLRFCGAENTGVILPALKSLPFCKSEKTGIVCSWKIDSAQRKKSVSGTREEGESKLREIAAAFSGADKNKIRAVFESISKTQTSLNDICTTIYEKSGEQFLLGELPEFLDSCRRLLTHFAGPYIEDREMDAIDQILEDNILDQDQKAGVQTGSVSKEQMLDTASLRRSYIIQLQEISEFFKKTEPHSPVSYCVDQAVKLSGMSLPEVLNELKRDQSSGYYFAISFNHEA